MNNRLRIFFDFVTYYTLFFRVFWSFFSMIKFVVCYSFSSKNRFDFGPSLHRLIFVALLYHFRLFLWVENPTESKVKIVFFDLSICYSFFQKKSSTLEVYELFQNPKNGLFEIASSCSFFDLRPLRHDFFLYTSNASHFSPPDPCFLLKNRLFPKNLLHQVRFFLDKKYKRVVNVVLIFENRNVAFFDFQETTSSFRDFRQEFFENLI